jgi:hypothetical protein
MSVENKIRELLTKKQLSEGVVAEAGDATNPMQGSSQASPAAGAMGAAKGKDSSIPAKIAGDATNPRQGSSQDASIDSERDDKTENPGAKEAGAVKGSNQGTLSQGGAGAAPNFTTVADPTSVVNQASSKGNVHQEEYDPEEDEDLEDDFEDEDEDEDLEESFATDLATLFDGNEDLTEDFRNKASSLFEAMVVARVSNEVAIIEDRLVEEAAELMEEYKSELVEKVDSYLGYVIENWIEENQLAVENGLRADVTESFIEGMKNLFAEHYIDVPEEKYDVLGEMQTQIDELASKLDETIAANVELHDANTELMKESVFSVVVEDLAKTDAEKFKSLVADVEFENADIFEEKLNVIKENYFPKNRTLSEDKFDDGVDNEFIEGSTVSQYVRALDQLAAKK